MLLPHDMPPPWAFSTSVTCFTVVRPDARISTDKSGSDSRKLSGSCCLFVSSLPKCSVSYLSIWFFFSLLYITYICKETGTRQLQGRNVTGGVVTNLRELSLRYQCPIFYIHLDQMMNCKHFCGHSLKVWVILTYLTSPQLCPMSSCTHNNYILNNYETGYHLIFSGLQSHDLETGGEIRWYSYCVQSVRKCVHQYCAQAKLTDIIPCTPTKYFWIYLYILVDFKLKVIVTVLWHQTLHHCIYWANKLWFDMFVQPNTDGMVILVFTYSTFSHSSCLYSSPHFFCYPSGVSFSPSPGHSLCSWHKALG